MSTHAPNVVIVNNTGGSTVVPKRTRHGLHLILTLLTGGLWLPVWIVAALHNHGKVKDAATGRVLN